ncbi:hypothetical protein XENTR_v10023185 [Xenopus tropicalis]|nr:hypothetical protein XENTR_v10023185 [Xenopus tropicalis]
MWVLCTKLLWGPDNIVVWGPVDFYMLLCLAGPTGSFSLSAAPQRRSAQNGHFWRFSVCFLLRVAALRLKLYLSWVRMGAEPLFQMKQTNTPHVTVVLMIYCVFLPEIICINMFVKV